MEFKVKKHWIILLFVLVILKVTGVLNTLFTIPNYTQTATQATSNAQNDSNNPSAQPPSPPPPPPNPTNTGTQVQSNTDLVNKNYSLFFQAYNERNYSNAVYYGEQSIPYMPADAKNLAALAYSYVELKNYQKASDYYNKALIIEPNNDDLKKKIKYLNAYQEDQNLNKSINNIRVTEKAPARLYALINTSLSSDIKSEVEGIFDLVWNVPDGRRLLTTIWESRIPIYIVQSDGNAHTTALVRNGTSTVQSITIPVKYIDKLNNPNLLGIARIDAFATFLHEFGHAYSRINDPRSFNSMEEEMGVEMLGYNISYRIVTGSYLNKKQVQDFYPHFLIGLLSDDHRNLPVYSGFDKRVQSYGVSLPYPEVYSDLVPMYKKLLSLGKTTQVASLDALIK